MKQIKIIGGNELSLSNNQVLQVNFNEPIIVNPGATLALDKFSMVCNTTISNPSFIIPTGETISITKDVEYEPDTVSTVSIPAGTYSSVNVFLAQLNTQFNSILNSNYVAAPGYEHDAGMMFLNTTDGADKVVLAFASVAPDITDGSIVLSQNLEPFGGIGVAFIMGHHRRAEHFKLRLEPAADDVQGEAAARNMIDGGALFGGDDGMNGRHMAGGENRAVACGGADASRPGEGFITGAVEIGFSAKTPPARHRHQGLEARRIGCAREVQHIVPGGMEHAVNGRDGAGAVHIQAEGSDLEAVFACRPACLRHVLTHLFARSKSIEDRLSCKGPGVVPLASKS